MGYKIRERREALRLSQEELSKKSGISRQTISAIETDTDRNVSTKTLKSLADALETTVAALFFDESA